MNLKGALRSTHHILPFTNVSNLFPKKSYQILNLSAPIWTNLKVSEPFRIYTNLFKYIYLSHNILKSIWTYLNLSELFRTYPLLLVACTVENLQKKNYFLIFQAFSGFYTLIIGMKTVFKTTVLLSDKKNLSLDFYTWQNFFILLEGISSTLIKAKVAKYINLQMWKVFDIWY